MDEQQAGAMLVRWAEQGYRVEAIPERVGITIWPVSPAILGYRVRIVGEAFSLEGSGATIATAVEGAIVLWRATGDRLGT